MTFSSQKIFLPKFKKRSLIIANCLINLFRKLNKDQKNSFLKFEKNFLCKRKDHLWSSFSFAINFVLELKMSFKKIGYDFWSNMIITLYSDILF